MGWGHLPIGGGQGGGGEVSSVGDDAAHAADGAPDVGDAGHDKNG